MESFTMFLWVISGLVTLVAGLVAYFAYIIHKQHEKYRHIPGPPLDSFWLGNIPFFMKEQRKGKFFSQICLELIPKYGYTFKFLFLNKCIVFTADPQAIQDLMASGNHPKSQRIYKEAGHIFGQRFLMKGLVTDCNESRWARKRAHMNQAFSRKYLAGLVDGFNEGADNMVQKAIQLADSKTKYSLLDLFSETTLDILVKVGFGRDLNSLSHNDSPFTKAVNASLEGMSVQNQSAFSKINPFLWSFRRNARKAVIFMRQQGREWLQERIKAMKGKENVAQDILTHLAELLDVVDDVEFEDILDDFCTFYLAGTETTATVCTWVVMAVEQNPRMKHKVMEEIDSVIGSRHFIDNDDIGKLTYLDMVIKEALRLYPPAPNTSRAVESDYKIGGLTIPADSDVFMSTFVCSRLPENNKDPLEFRPERFAVDSNERPPIYSYFPFTLGPRICLGQSFAKMEAKIMLSKLYQRIHVDIVPDQSFEIKERSTIHPKDRLICTFSARE